MEYNPECGYPWEPGVHLNKERLRVLVADYELATRLLLQGMLTREATEVELAASWTQARERIHAQRYDGLFLDPGFPDGDGIALIREARESQWNSHTPIIIVTAGRDLRVQENAFAAGASFILYKPVDLESLRRLVQATRGALAQERRRSIRVPFDCLVSLRWEPGGQVQGRSLDLSVDSISVRGAVDLKAGTVVRVSFAPGDSAGPLEAGGVVASVRGENICGIRFTFVAPGGRERLQRIVEQHWRRKAGGAP